MRRIKKENRNGNGKQLRPLMERLNGHDCYLLDTSTILKYDEYNEKELIEVFDSADHKGKIFITPSVLKEIKSKSNGSDLEEILLNHNVGVLKVDEEKQKSSPYWEPARIALEKTHKHECASYLLPYLKGKKDPTKSNKEYSEVVECTGKVSRILDRDYGDVILAHGIINKARMIRLLEIYWLVSNTDIGELVEATKMTNGRNGNGRLRVAIITEDRHFDVDIIRNYANEQGIPKGHLEVIQNN